MMKDMILTLSIISLVGMIIKTEYEEKKAEKDGYKQGYHDARTLYECAHDRSECELIKDTLDAN